MTDVTDSGHRLQIQVSLQESPPRVYVDFTDNTPDSGNRVTIAKAGSPDNHLKMWLYTNGTHNGALTGPRSGRLGYLQKYIGIGNFEARLFTNGNYKEAAHRVAFSIPGPSDTPSSDTPSSDTTTNSNEPDYRLLTQVRMQESPARVYVDFVDADQSDISRVSIARAGSPDSQLVMWLYTNGTHNPNEPGPLFGRLGFRQQYVGTGEFEARFFADGDSEEAVLRTSFTIP